MGQKKTLVMGIGNYLMCDEGVGVHVAEWLQKEVMPEHVSVLDGGTGGFHLLEYFEKHDHVILVDATLDGREPGTIRKIKPRYVKDFPPAMSTHDIGLKDMVRLCSLWIRCQRSTCLLSVSILYKTRE
jgi:hydrogenase maturation protease